jgi:DNA-binding MarR family transcriptional regulator
VNAPLPAKDGRQSILELNQLITETRGLFHDLEEVSDQILAKDDLSGQERLVMMSLRKLGLSTVPQLARIREVSRQYVQTSVNELERRGLVALHDNPAHKRSRLVGLTPAGEVLILGVMAREGEAMHRVAVGLHPEQVREAVAVLRRVRERLLEAAD